MRLREQPTVRLIPAAVLEPRIRLVQGGEVITMEAFDLAAIMAEHRVPGVSVKASPAMRDRIDASFGFSALSAHRFNAVGERAYYAGTALPTAIHEIRHHLENDDGVPYDGTIVYRAVTARVGGVFLDLRRTNAAALAKEEAAAYPVAQELARQMRPICDGILYPSARHSDGVNVAVFEPGSLSGHRMDRFISFEPVQGEERRFGYRLHVQPHRMEIARALGMATG